MATNTTANPNLIQFRYYGLDNENNMPKDTSWIGATADGAEAKNLLSNYGPAKKIGIQTLPGVIFYLNNYNPSTGIIVDHTGIYELDLRNTTTSIRSLFFDVNSLARVDEIDNASIIVDILYT